ncbi:hypothetical protein [Sphingobacterium sp. LRF_L2]|uniref:hypothetical protein n=1 Tax=Sphingobacterium sp. LRF_L2 TaxID=3369421 RepID=UPI003F5EE7DE
MAIITCPETCEEVEAPKFDFDNCNEEANAAQIAWLYITTPDAPSFTDWKTPTEWAARLGNDPTVEGHDIRFLKGIGEIPKPTANTVAVSGRRTKVVGRSRTITFRVDNTNEVNHDAMRKLQCGGDIKIWYGTIDGLLYGGNDGIDVFVDPGASHGSGDTDIINHEYAISYSALLDPERTKSPIAF